ncbi:MAG: response regulator [Ignavibacteria bacterium]|nr:response regulator [Ignavibacteria bacterium]
MFPALQHTSDGAALALAASLRPDVILLDIVMPNISGYDICTRLKSDSALRDIPVVFLTALKEDKESRIRALECGAEAFLSKPIDESELAALLRAMAKISAASIAKGHEKERLATLVEERTRALNATHIATLNLLEDLKRENEARKRSEDALCARNEELSRFNKAAVDRELRMIELKAEINALCETLELPPRHRLVTDVPDVDIARGAPATRRRTRAVKARISATFTGC